MDSSGVALEQVQLRMHGPVLFKTHCLPLSACNDAAELLRAIRGAVRGMESFIAHISLI